MRVKGGDGDFGAASCFTCKALNFKGACSKFWHLGLEELYEELRVASGKAEVHAAESFVHVIQVRAYTLSGNLFLVWDDACCATKVDEYGAPLHALHNTGYDLALLVPELFKDGKLFGLPDLLYDYLLCSLGCDAAEVVLGLEREYDLASKF